MVNELRVKKPVVVKLEAAGARERKVTAKGGCALVEKVAARTGLWRDCERSLPKRRDPAQGFSTVSAVAVLCYGLLTGGEGFSATEPLRGDTPLLSLLGLSAAPSAETSEEVVKYLSGAEVGGHEAALDVMGRQAERCLLLEKRAELLKNDGYLYNWIDGSLLETEGARKDALVWMKGQWGQTATALFVGPYTAAVDFAREKPEQKRADGTPSCEGELMVGRRLLERAAPVLKKTKLMKDALFTLDALYADEETLKKLESEEFKGSSYIVGAGKLVLVQTVLSELAASEWTDTTALTHARGWAESAVCVCWLQCAEWSKKRLLVGRRYRVEGEMMVQYSGVVTALHMDDPRVLAKMAREKVPFGEAVWRLYAHKQALENYWKDFLSDMGLHHPPCAKAAVNAVFFAIAALARNLAEGTKRLCLDEESKNMRLWRFRRDVLDLPVRVARHARKLVATILDARETLVRQVLRAMECAAAL